MPLVRPRRLSRTASPGPGLVGGAVAAGLLAFSGCDDSSSPTDAKTSGWGNTPFATRAEVYRAAGATLVHRVHPQQPGWTPVATPTESFLDVWVRGTRTVARFAYEEPDPFRTGDAAIEETYFDVSGQESSYPLVSKIRMGSPAAILWNKTIVRSTWHREAWLDASLQPHGLWGYEDGSQRYLAAVVDPLEQGNVFGNLRLACRTGLWGTVHPLPSGAYACVGIQQGGTLWTMAPDFVELKSQPLARNRELGGLLLGDSTRPVMIKSYHARHDAAGVLVAVSVDLGEASRTSGEANSGRVVLLRHDGSKLAKLAVSVLLDTLSWKSTAPGLSNGTYQADGAPNLLVTRDATDPSRPYVLVHYGSTVRVLRQEGDSLRLLYKAVASSPFALVPGGLASIPVAVHRGKLFVKAPVQGNSNATGMASSDGPLVPFAPSLVGPTTGILTMLKSEGSSLWFGVRRREDAPYVHHIGELGRMD